MSSLINAIYNVLDGLYWSTYAVYSTLITGSLARIRGIRIGRGTKFFGRTKFKKARTASIVVGKNNCFRSTPTSNLIGVNRPCIVSALEPESIVQIGDDCGFSGTVIGCFKSITIGHRVKCGANTLITDGDWHAEDPRSSTPKPIVIGDNVWLGVNVTVMKGVTIGANSLIGAGSIVTKDIPANVIAAGNPCVVIRSVVQQ
jgi:acetyltransferase-like isoleucine patch superfamily enzyme